jgi:hypothetical protein
MIIPCNSGWVGLAWRGSRLRRPARTHLPELNDHKDNMFNFPKSKQTFTTNFICQACGHEFRREMKRIYVHVPAAITDEKKGGHSPYIIPELIACPKCQAIDQYELGSQTKGNLRLALMAAMINGGELAPGHVVKLVTFSLYDGTPMHPLDAIDFYRAKVEKNPSDLLTRMRYGNTMRSIGWLDNAEEQYQAVLAATPDNLEAWLSMASLHMARKHAAKAKKALMEIVKRAPQSKDPQWQEYLSQSQAYLNGIWPMEDLTPDSLMLHTQVTPKKSQRKKRW